MYDDQILRILLDVGVRGISAKKLAKHVYNHFSTFFYQPDFNEIYRYVNNYIKRNSRSKRGLLEHAERWGYYRLNTRSSAARQLLMTIGKDSPKEEKEEKQVAQDLSLLLFE